MLPGQDRVAGASGSPAQRRGAHLALPAELGGQSAVLALGLLLGSPKLCVRRLTTLLEGSHGDGGFGP